MATTSEWILEPCVFHESNLLQGDFLDSVVFARVLDTMPWVKDLITKPALITVWTQVSPTQTHERHAAPGLWL